MLFTILDTEELARHVALERGAELLRGGATPGNRYKVIAQKTRKPNAFMFLKLYQAT